MRLWINPVWGISLEDVLKQNDRIYKNGVKHMKLPEIKIMVKETKEERREMTIEEIALARMLEEETIAPDMRKRVKDRLPDYVLDSWSYNGKYPSVFGTFQTETTREATPEEKFAYHITEVYKLCNCGGISGKFCKSGKCPFKPRSDELCDIGAKVVKLKQLLAGKEIYPELI